MDPQKTLIDIAQVAQRVLGTLVRHTGRRTAESFQLEKIIVGASALLEAQIKTSLLNNGRIDDRLVDWLTDNEPQVCLQTLKRMEATLNRKHTYRGNFMGTSSFMHSQDISNEAIRLFQLHEGYFHYLLMPMEVWNRETDKSRSNLTAQHDLLRTEDAIDNRKVRRITRLDTSCVPQGGEMEKQGVGAEKLNKDFGMAQRMELSGHTQTYYASARGGVLRIRFCGYMEKVECLQYSCICRLHEISLAGAGKSVLAASVIENLKEALEDGELLAFFYCDFRSERSTSAAEVLRSLLSQLLRQSSWNVVDHEDLIDELVKQSDEGSSTVSDVMLLANYISRVVGRFNQRPCIVIDALDECNHVEELLNALVEMSKSNLRLLVISRPLQVIKDSLSELPLISMDGMKYEVMTDIKLHITRVLDSHRRLRIMDSNLKQEIYSILSKKADGMFRWVQCQLDILKRCMTPARIREALDDLPTDLYATYSRILLRIDLIDEEEIVRRALEWVVAALAPLQLSQLMEGLSIDLEKRVLDHTCGPVHGPALLDALGSLVAHDELTDVIILSHFSVKEYLTGEPTRMKFPKFHINEQAAHTRLALRCMFYIVTYLKLGRQSVGHEASSFGTRIYDDAVTRTRERPGNSYQSAVPHPLLGYVSKSGFHHLSHVSPRNQAVLQAITDLVSETQQNPLEWEWLCNTYFSLPIRTFKLEHDLMLYILIAFAPETMLRFYLDTSKPKPKDGTNPLIYAASSGTIEHCRILLSRGVSLNHRGWDYYSHRQVLPLEVALRSGSIDVVDLFLRAESPVPQELFMEVLREQRCHFRSSNVARLLQTDEFVEWAVSSRNEELLLRALDPTYYHPFPDFRPSEKDALVIERRLVQLNYDPRNRFNTKSLCHAASAGQISVVKNMLSSGIQLPSDIILKVLDSDFHPKAAMIRFLLDAGCNVHVTSPRDGDTPLHLVLAIRSFIQSFEADCLQCVQLLVGAGCDPSLYNLFAKTPLHLATRNGYTFILEYLLSLHVQLPSDILLDAVLSPNASAASFLISRGASVHAVSAGGETPLHNLHNGFGISSKPDERLEFLKILINAGCNPRLPNARGETVLDIAAKHAFLEVVQYLLSYDIPLSSSLLQSACGNGCNEGSSMIKFLIRKGVDIHSTCENGDNLLHLSMRTNSEAECLRRVEILVNAGCDVRARNLACETPYHVAARFGHISVMEYLFSLSGPSDETFINALLEGIFKSYRWTTYHCRAMIRFLLDKGIGVQIVDKDDKGLLHAALSGSLGEEETLELVKILIHSGCKPSVPGLNQETSLHLAARRGYISVICYLLSLDPNLPSDILLAASKGYSKRAQAIRYLINKSARVSVATTDGDTPLHLLLAQGDELDCLESTKILVDAGCNPCARNLAGETPLHTAARSGFVSILKYFLSRGILPSDVLSVARPVTAHFLLGERIDVCQSVSFDDDKELVHRILDFDLRFKFSENDEDEHADVECSKILLGLGWDPSLRNSSGETPMHVATRRKRISVVRYLLSQKVPLPPDILLATVSRTDGLDRLSLALTRFLIREGAMVNTTAPNGDTPLHLVLRHGFDSDPYISYNAWEFAQILLNNGSDPTARNMDGQTPLIMAEEKGHFFKENFLRLVRNSAHARTLN
ncbi:ankyrin repeat-containing domain protein [Chiua virens]|nr:ankyrin repeat-containing domain protein [Chiua virens]